MINKIRPIPLASQRISSIEVNTILNKYNLSQSLAITFQVIDRFECTQKDSTFFCPSK